MSIEQDILKVAMLGTDSCAFDIEIFPQDIKDAFKDVDSAESSYLNALSLYKAYTDGGRRVKKLDGISQTVPKPPKEILPVCSSHKEEFLQMLLQEGADALESFLPKLVSIVQKQNEVLPAEYIFDIKNLDIDTIKAFGKRGEYVASHLGMGVVDSLEYMDMTKAQRFELFEDTIKKQDTSKILEFLRELFDAFSSAERLKYVKYIEAQHTIDKSIVEFLEERLQANPKRYKNIKTTIYKIKLKFKDSETVDKLFEEYFSKILIKKMISFSIIDAQEFEKLCGSLEFYSSVDESMEFVFYITPIKYWLDVFDMDLEKFLKRMKNLKTTYKTQEILKSLMKQAIDRKDKELFLALVDLKVDIDSDFSYIFDEDELFEFVQRYIKVLDKSYIDLIDVIKKDKKFHQAWSEEFSMFFIKHIVKNYRMYKKEWTKAIWVISPYLHISAMRWLEQRLKKPKLSSEFENLAENFSSIYKIKDKFEDINKKVV